MRLVLALLVGAAAVITAAPQADANDHEYIQAGSELGYATITAPHPAAEMGARGLAAFETVRMWRADPKIFESLKTVPIDAVSGAAAPAPRWLAAAAAPFGLRGDHPHATTLLRPGAQERIGALLVKRAFRVGEERDKLKVLTLRVRYRDGLIARVNGVEVARRNLRDDAGPAELAVRTHGWEWETIYVPVTRGLLREDGGDDELELEVHTGAQRLAPWVDAELAGGEGARVVRGPLVQRVEGGGALIVFETDLPAHGEVLFGQAAAYNRRATDAAGADGTRHVIALDGLTADREIHYQVVVGAERTADEVFHTAPADGEPVRFVVYGDVRSGHAVHAKLLARIDDEAPDFIVSTGDMVLRGSDEADWQRFFQIAGPTLARIPLYPVIGNHDRATGDRRRFDDIFALPPPPDGRPDGAAWWSFDVSGVHFAMIDSNRYDDARQLAWLDADLAAARAHGARAIFAAMHHGPWSHGPHGGDATAVKDYAPILEKYGVAVVFSGHDHLYQRGKVGALNYVVSGGGGASLYAARCGEAGKPRCHDDGTATIISEHHYVAVEVYRDYVRMCARRADGTPLEKCVDVTLPTAPQP